MTVLVNICEQSGTFYTCYSLQMLNKKESLKQQQCYGGQQLISLIKKHLVKDAGLLK